MKSNQKGKRCKEKTSTTESLLFVVDGLPSLFRLLLLLLPPFFDFSQLLPGGGLLPPIARPLIGSAWARGAREGGGGETEGEGAPRQTASEEENERAASRQKMVAAG